MKILKIIGGIMFVVGLGFFIGAIASVFSTRDFIEQSELAIGEVVDIAIKTDRDSKGSTTTYRFPVIQFEDKMGTVVTFESSTSSNAIIIGESVEVRYLPDDPKDAKVANSFFAIWGISVILGIFGIIFPLVGMVLFWFGIRDDVNEKKAAKYSRQISAKIKGVIYNQSVTVNGRSPFVIEAQWLNPDTNELHIFKSKNLWYDPSEYLKQEDIIVKADRNNLKKYWMDISFLPKQA